MQLGQGRGGGNGHKNLEEKTKKDAGRGRVWGGNFPAPGIMLFRGKKGEYRIEVQEDRKTLAFLT